MRCYNCKKNFDYEKYYGICPKCGCFNRKVTPQEQHQEYHDTYDKGYRHTENASEYGQEGGTVPPNTAYIQVSERRQGAGTGGTVFLLASLAVFLLVFVGGTILGIAYEDFQEEQIQKSVLETEVSHTAHVMGEKFSFQGMTLSVTEARVLELWTSQPLPPGKRVAAVKLEGTGDGSWNDANVVSDAYIRCGDVCYPQIYCYDYEPYGNMYRMPAFEPYSLSGSTQAEGWIAFLVDTDLEAFTLCLEDRVDADLAYIETIHSVEIQLEGDGTDD